MRIVAAVCAAACSLTVAAPLLAYEGQYFQTTSPDDAPLRGDLPALALVDQEFDNGDHRVRRLAVYPQRNYYDPGPYPLNPALIFAFEDQNGDDPIEGHVRWVDLRQHALRSVSGNCRGTCNLTIPALPAGDSIALVGFDFTYTDGADHNIEEIAVIPAPQMGFISVTFRDHGGTAPFRVTIYYARLVALEISAMGTRASSTPARDSVTTWRLAGNAVLRGFRLAFTNGDHFLERWSVDLCVNGSVDCGDNNDLRVRFRDINGDDPFDWFVSYTILRPGVDG